MKKLITAPESYVKDFLRLRRDLDFSTHLNDKSSILHHPIGLSAGFDKDANFTDSAKWLGFSFSEIGTLTPRKQNGNPKPRLFRLKECRALLNRMGFNNCGNTTSSEKLRTA